MVLSLVSKVSYSNTFLNGIEYLDRIAENKSTRREVPMAAVKRVLVVVQEWLGESNQHPGQAERTIEEARMRVQMMRQMYL